MSSIANQPRVSAVIPTRNRPDLLRRAVMSVLQQTIADIEAVVVIDGPDPATVTMLNDIHDDRLQVIELPWSVGGSDARNIGAQMARGHWVGLLDDDDEWLPRKCEQQIRLGEQCIDGRPLVVSMFLARREGHAERLQPSRLPMPDEPFAEYMFSPRCGFQTSTFFCTRELLRSVPFASGLKGCQDLDWLLRVTAETDVRLVICEEPLAVFHEPETRPSVSRGLDWRFRLEWGRARKAWMGHRAYSRFIVTVCATRAAAGPFSLRAFASLFYECALVGTPELQTLGHLVALFFVSPGLRQKARRWTTRSRAANRAPAERTVAGAAL
jgi:glycosyltransferase involved in cell wall biosynthesis